MSDARSHPFRSGFVTVVGRPNVGKSTLVNRLVGQKVAIVSDKPQTTRNRILAVVNRPGAQLVLFDTPGIHKPEHEMNRRMVDTAVRSISQGDVVVWVNEVTEPPGPSDAFIQRLLEKSRLPVVLALNKIDRVPKPKILPALEAWSRVGKFDDIVPISAKDGDNVDRLEQVLVLEAPRGRAALSRGLPDRPARALLRGRDGARADPAPHAPGDPVRHGRRDRVLQGGAGPGADPVRDPGRARQPEGHPDRPGGSMLKLVGSEARQQIEHFLGAKVFLGLFVKVRERWRENESLLDEMGMGESGGRLGGSSE